MPDVITIENAKLAYDARDHESTQARYAAGRLKFACCPMCGSADGMQATHREVLVQLDAETVTLLAPWHRQPGISEYLFHACDRCNRRGIVAIGYERVRIIDIPTWLNDTGPVSPDAKGDDSE